MSMTGLEKLDGAVNLALRRRRPVELELENLRGKFILRALIRNIKLLTLRSFLDGKGDNDRVKKGDDPDTS